MNCVRWLAAGLVLAFAPAFAQQEVLREFETRPGIIVRTLEIAPAAATAAILLLPGGDGAVLLGDNGAMRRYDDNFMVRTRHQFAQEGFRTYVVDVPSDRRRPPYLEGFRDKLEWALDIQSLVRRIHAETGLKIWLAGTSASALPAAGMAGRLAADDAIAGAIATSACFSYRGASLPFGFATLSKPVLVVHHRRDACDLCQPSAIEPLFQRIGAERKKLLWFDGGLPAQTCGAQGCNVCGPLAAHGFHGIEGDVVHGIAQWIRGMP